MLGISELLGSGPVASVVSSSAAGGSLPVAPPPVPSLPVLTAPSAPVLGVTASAGAPVTGPVAAAAAGPAPRIPLTGAAPASAASSSRRSAPCC